MEAAYQVVARRYRPQRFDELVGQEHVARGLSGAITSGRIGHAYLFTGARGVGKTSAARIFAKALECVRGPAAEPCNDCDACLAVAAGQDVDVVEIDAASNRGIDEIRQLRQNVAVRPARGRYKIYIIDEVHMLTREAFNALLKTLEEPPSHVKFVLCTTEPDKLPITILSRCQRFDFTTVAPSAITRRLAQIVEAEGADVTPAALELIARRAAGSMRDSQSLLEQLLGAAGGQVDVDEVHAAIGTGREERIAALLAAIAGRDPASAIAALDATLGGGADPGGVLDQLVAALRDCLLASVGCGREMMTSGGFPGVDLAALGRELGTATLLAMLQSLDHALARMRSSGHAAVLAEMAVVRLAKFEDLDDLASAIERVSAADHPAAPQAPEPREKKTPDLTPAAAPADHRPPAASDDGGSPAVASDAMEPAPQPAADRQPAALPADAGAAWRLASETFGGLAADFAATASRVEWKGEALEVTLPADAATAASFLSRPEVVAGIAGALSDLAGRRLRYGIVTAAVTAAETAAATAAAPPVVSQSALLRAATEHPLVARARVVFDAAIRKVEPRRRPPTAATEPAVRTAATTIVDEDADSGAEAGAVAGADDA